ncbi:hypothetical protein CC80DRAFT_594970 [Byssothecium circinans]|uniref:BTB domain-containing protein n=1 Tax=Byssothecium circinans TaxID=147558 RepID=A0A6A5TQL7_9PLEO|nr:hypothetical protein CC80DRAFT_594970 [Byssothecium circinans]
MSTPTLPTSLYPLSKCTHPLPQPPSTCYDLSDIVTVTIRVLQDGMVEDFLMIRPLLSWHSGFFNAALGEKWGYKAEGKAELAIEDDIDAFRAFKCWIHTSKLRDDPTETSDEMTGKGYLKNSNLINIWEFAEYRVIPALKNAAIDMLHERTSDKWAAMKSDLRRFVVDTTASAFSAEKLDKRVPGWRKDLPEDFVASFRARRLDLETHTLKDREGVSKSEWTKLNRCNWHDHSGPGGALRLKDVSRHIHFPEYASKSPGPV